MRFLALPVVCMAEAEAEALVEVLDLAGEEVGMGIKQLILLILHPMLHGRMVAIIRLYRGKQQGQT